MRFLRTILLVAACIPFAGIADVPPTAAETSSFEQCPPKGNAKKINIKSLNELKRRLDAPETADINAGITLSKLLKPGDDIDRWSPDQAATITGYVVAVSKGGVETSNCHAEHELYRDTHIALAKKRYEADKKKWVVVEITPQMRYLKEAEAIDWSTDTLKQMIMNRKVRVTGWLMFDVEHADESENTKPGRTKNWRATAWEIHPITDIDVVP